MNKRLYLSFFCVGLLTLALWVVETAAQLPSPVSTIESVISQVTPRQNGGQLSGEALMSGQKRQVELDQARRTALFAFVQEHHPELTRLLKSLEKSRPRLFDLAMRSLSNTYQRLESLQSQGKMKQYEEALENWKLSSRIKLSAAQIAVKDTPQNRQKLETLIAQQYDSRRVALESEQARLRERLERVSELLEKQADRQLEIERTMDLAMRTASRQMQRTKNDRGERNAGAAGKKAAPTPIERGGKELNRGKARKSGQGKDDGSQNR